ncbi:hypothetical protein BDZ89DRAFT_1145883 [Hymenopellis radicata]|nr:hypothetical protein BDZ89DRAFT_1145883 [Hymenopellis radicata]
MVRVLTVLRHAASSSLRFTPQMFEAMENGVYLFFASFMVCSVFFIFFLLSETKQIPLEMMDDLFAPGVCDHGMPIPKL